MRRFMQRVAVGLLACCAAVNLLTPPAAAAYRGSDVTLLLLPGLTWEHITPDTTPNLHRMLETGAAANLALPLWANDLSGYIALGSGSRSEPHKDGTKAYQSNERVMNEEEAGPVVAAQLYERNIGVTPAASIVVPGIEALKKANANHPSQSVPGALGQSVTSLGGRVALIGNSDLGTEVYRPASMTAMDEHGQIGTGRIGRDLLLYDQQAPFGVRTDYQKLFQLHESLKDKTNLIVIEPGDVTRVAAQRHDLPPAQTQSLYLRYLAETDRLLGRLFDENPERTLIVTSPLSMADAGIGHKSAGVLLMAEKSIAPGSLLSSNTTRQPGFVTIYDVAPTILSCLGLPEYIAGGAGQPIGTIGQVEASGAFLQHQVQQLSMLNQYRPLFVKGFAEAMLVVILVAFVMQVLGHRHLRWPITVMAALLPVPVLYLLAAAWGFSGLTDMLWKLGLLSAVYWGGLAALKSDRARLLLTSAITIALLSFDMLRQGTWMSTSAFGFDLLRGARYYGIGNEYMGILIGAALLVFLLARRRFASSVVIQMIAAFGFAMLIFLLAAPQFGTNAGGAAAAVITFLYAWLQGADGQFSRQKWAWVLGASGVICVAILLLHISLPAEQQTHIGRAGAMLLHGDREALKEIVGRKWALNWRLLDVSVWGKVFWGMLLVLIAEVVRKSYAALPFLIGGTATFLLNDSGVIAAAGCMLFGAVWLLTERFQPAVTAAVEQVSDEAVEYGSDEAVKQ